MQKRRWFLYLLSPPFFGCVSLLYYPPPSMSELLVGAAKKPPPSGNKQCTYRPLITWRQGIRRNTVAVGEPVALFKVTSALLNTFLPLFLLGIIIFSSNKTPAPLVFFHKQCDSKIHQSSKKIVNFFRLFHSLLSHKHSISQRLFFPSLHQN